MIYLYLEVDLSQKATMEFSTNHLQDIEDLIEWINLLREDPFYTNRLKIWKKLRLDGADAYLLVEAFKRVGYLK